MPAVEPGFEPGGKNLTQNQIAWNFREPQQIRPPFPGGKDARPTAGQEARRYTRLMSGAH